MKPIFVLALLGLSFVLGVQAQDAYHWRLSAKVMLSSTNTWPGPDSGLVQSRLSSAERIRSQMDFANRILRNSGLSAELVLSEIQTIGGPADPDITSRWFGIDVRNGSNRQDLENVAYADARYRFNRGAINVYINNSPSSGESAIPGGFGFLDLDDDDDDILLLGQGTKADTVMHEVGHYLGLFHTQGKNCAGCGEDGKQPGDCEDDDVADTIKDSDCWANLDAVARNNYGKDYADLDSAQKWSVDHVFYNVMSYHRDTEAAILQGVLTPGQIERLGHYTNSDRRAVASGDVWFVKPDGDDGDDGDEIDDAFRSVTHAVIEARDRNPSSQNLVLIRPGTYVEKGVLTIHQPLTINAYAGPVRIEAGGR
jgi:hypothetical protein